MQKKKTRTGWIGWLIGLGVIAGAALSWVWWQNRPTADAGAEILRTAAVTRGDLDITVAASGNVVARRRADFVLSTSGTVSEIYVTAGARIKATQLLARLESTDLERAVTRAEIALEQARLNLKTLTDPASAEDVALAKLATQQAAQALETARLGKQTAQSDADAQRVQAQRARENTFKDWQYAQGGSREEQRRDVYETTLEQENIARINADAQIRRAQEQWLSAYQRYRQAQRAQEQLEEGPNADEVRLAELQVQRAELSLAQARQNLADATLYAPVDGVMAQINIHENVLAPMGVRAFTMIDDSAFYVEVDVDEIDIGKIVPEQSVAVTLDAYPDMTLTGIVERIAPTSQKAAGVVSYRVRVRLTDTDQAQVRDGMTASILVQTSTLTDIVLIPNWAVRTDQSSGAIYTYKIEDDTPYRTNLSVGKRNETHTQVLEGVAAGDSVGLIAETRSLQPSDGTESQ